MSPLPGSTGSFGSLLAARNQKNDQADKPTGDGLALEAWAQGQMVGALVVMSCITLANMRKGVLLHKLILLEVNIHLRHDSFFTVEWWAHS
jgi:hypothetical protein